jgi:hypothetical protein
MAIGSLGFRTKLVYGFGTVAYGIKDNGFNFLLLIFYNQLLGPQAQLVGHHEAASASPSPPLLLQGKGRKKHCAPPVSRSSSPYTPNS